jgi:hypothetical protein
MCDRTNGKENKKNFNSTFRRWVTPFFIIISAAAPSLKFEWWPS